jgi:hypothetical protein
MRITKHFVTVGKRRVHYLRAGSGPYLLTSPWCSSTLSQIVTGSTMPC